MDEDNSLISVHISELNTISRGGEAANDEILDTDNFVVSYTSDTSGAEMTARTNAMNINKYINKKLGESLSGGTSDKNLVEEIENIRDDLNNQIENLKIYNNNQARPPKGFIPGEEIYTVQNAFNWTYSQLNALSQDSAGQGDAINQNTEKINELDNKITTFEKIVQSEMCICTVDRRGGESNQISINTPYALDISGLPEEFVPNAADGNWIKNIYATIGYFTGYDKCLTINIIGIESSGDSTKILFKIVASENNVTTPIQAVLHFTVLKNNIENAYSHYILPITTHGGNS